MEEFKKIFRLKENEIDILVDFILENMKNGGIILLKGNLGSGKTTLVKAFAKKLGIKEATSPTFSIEHVYDDKIYHYDLYNTTFEKFMELGLYEEFEKDGFHFVEWADSNLEKLLSNLGYHYMIIEIIPVNSEREYRIKYA